MRFLHITHGVLVLWSLLGVDKFVTPDKLPDVPKPSPRQVEPQPEPTPIPQQCQCGCGKTNCNCGMAMTRCMDPLQLNEAAVRQVMETEPQQPRLPVQWLVFTAKWCAPCISAQQEFRPWLEKSGWRISDGDAQDVHLRFVDYDQHESEVKRFNITQLPTYVLLADGKEVLRHETYPGKWALANEYIAARAKLPPSVSAKPQVGAISVGSITRDEIAVIKKLFAKNGPIRLTNEKIEQKKGPFVLTVPELFSAENRVTDHGTEVKFNTPVSIRADLPLLKRAVQECSGFSLNESRLDLFLPGLPDVSLTIEE